MKQFHLKNKTFDEQKTAFFIFLSVVLLLVTFVPGIRGETSDTPVGRNSYMVPFVLAADVVTRAAPADAASAPVAPEAPVFAAAVVAGPVVIAPSATGLVIDVASVALSGNMDLNLTASVFFRGKNSSTMVFDGQGMFFQMPRTASPFLQVAAGKSVKLQNLVLKDFSPVHIRLAAGASLVFGDNVYIQLADNAAPVTTSFVFDGARSVIDGRGKFLTLGAPDAVLVNDGKDVTFKDMTVLGLRSTGTAHTLRCAGANAQVVFDDAKLVLDSFFNMIRGNVLVRNHVAIKGRGTTFAWTSAGSLAIDSNATLKLDYGTTFSYDSSSRLRTQLIMTDASSLLHVNNATLCATHTGVILSRGSMYFENVVTLSSEASYEAEAIV